MFCFLFVWSENCFSGMQWNCTLFYQKKFDQEQKIAENSNKGEIYISANLYLLTERAFHEQMQNLI